MILSPDWTGYYDTYEEIQRDLGDVKFESQGWYVEQDHTLLLVQHGAKIEVSVWSYSNPLKLLEVLLRLPRFEMEISEGVITGLAKQEN